MATDTPVILEIDESTNTILNTYNEYNPDTNTDGKFFILRLYYQECQKNGNKLNTSIPITENTQISLETNSKDRIADINPLLIARNLNNNDFEKFLNSAMIKDTSDNVPKNENFSIKKSYVRAKTNSLEYTNKFDIENWYAFGYGTALSLTNYIVDKTDKAKNLYCYHYNIGNFNGKKYVLQIYIKFSDTTGDIKYTPYNPNQQSLCKA